MISKCLRTGKVCWLCSLNECLEFYKDVFSEVSDGVVENTDDEETSEVTFWGNSN